MDSHMDGFIGHGGTHGPSAVATEDAHPVSSDEFAAAMDRLGPFEPEPAVAVAVSGGADSLALCGLAARWATARCGSAAAIIVDHRLRPGSGAEARQAAAWASELGAKSVILPWIGPKPATAVQERARAARYQLLSAWCRRAGVLHLLIGHHGRDQAETVAMRLARGRGRTGLAGMAPVVERPDVRLLRPLLSFPPARLRSLLRAWGQAWIEDPANEDTRFERTDIRRALAADGVREARLIRVSRRSAQWRSERDQAIAELAAIAIALDPAGYAEADPHALVHADWPVAIGLLRNVIASVGGGRYPPAHAKVERLLRRSLEGHRSSAGTVGRCQVLWRGDRLLICRERRGLPDPLRVRSGLTIQWDGRFFIRLSDDLSGDLGGPTGHDPTARLGCHPPSPAPVWLQPLSRVQGTVADAMMGRDEDDNQDLGHGGRGKVHPGWATLPALVDENGLIAVPHLAFKRADPRTRDIDFAVASFRPAIPVAGAGCFLAYEQPRLMS